MTVHIVHLIGGADDETAEFVETKGAQACTLVCRYRGKRIEADADDFFEALCRIRRHLEAEGLIPFCYGASLNVYPSAMARQMSGGKMAYKMTRGRQALRADLVQIFDDGADVIPVSVESQRQFSLDWLESLSPT